MKESVELLSTPINFAVVRLPNRRYPGVVVQGDTLNEVVKDLGVMTELLRTGHLDDLADELSFMKEKLSEALGHYEQVCAAHRIELPYPKPGDGRSD